MVQKLSTPIEQAVVGPHIRHPNPHPQYMLGASVLSNDTPSAGAPGAPGSPGISLTVSRSDHTHPLPGVATTTTIGFMSVADKVKLDSLKFPQVIAPLAGAVLDIDNGTLVWNIDNFEQVSAA